MKKSILHCQSLRERLILKWTLVICKNVCGVSSTAINTLYTSKGTLNIKEKKGKNRVPFFSFFSPVFFPQLLAMTTC